MKVLKKLACLMLVVGLVFASGIFVACGKSDKNDSTDKQDGVSMTISVAEANQILGKSETSTDFSKSDAVTIINQVKSNMLSASAVSFLGKHYKNNPTNKVDTAIVTNSAEHHTQTTDDYTRDSWEVLDTDADNEIGNYSIICYERLIENGTTTYTKRKYTADAYGISGFLHGKFIFMLDGEAEFTANNIDSISVKNGSLQIKLSAELFDEEMNENSIIENGYVTSSTLTFTDEGTTYEYRAVYAWNETVDSSRANDIPDVEWVEE